MIGFSIIICSYNPNDEIFNRLINAVENLDTSELQFEVIIIDNNSSLSLASREYVSDFLKRQPNACVIFETNPGLTSARIAGIKQAKYDWLIFFDDDNEPDSNYLKKSQDSINQYPKVGAWGPGEVNVEYQNNNLPNWYYNRKEIFQGILLKEISIGNKQEWSICYPNGTGLILKIEIANEYIRMVETKAITLTDRIGKSLSSGGDTQMVLLALKNGYFAGLNPQLKLNHLISVKKTKTIYLLKQSYMTASCFVKAYNEIYFESNQIPVILEGNKRVLQVVILTLRKRFLKINKRDFLIEIYSRLGEINARYLACIEVKNKPFFLRIFEKFINV